MIIFKDYSNDFQITTRIFYKSLKSRMWKKNETRGLSQKYKIYGLIISFFFITNLFLWWWIALFWLETASSFFFGIFQVTKNTFVSRQPLEANNIIEDQKFIWNWNRVLSMSSSCKSSWLNHESVELFSTECKESAKWRFSPQQCYRLLHL